MLLRWITMGILLCVLSAKAGAQNPIEGFGSYSNEFDFYSSKTTSPAPSSSLITVSRDRLGTKLIWSIWLEKADYKLYPGLISGYSSESVLVRLELSPNSTFLHMFEDDSAVDDPRGDSLIDRFPVISSDSKTITFDFSQGLKTGLYRSFVDPKTPLRFQSDYSYIYNFQNDKDVVTFAQLVRLMDENLSTLILHHAFRLFDDSSGFQSVKVVKPLELGFLPASLSSESDSDEAIVIRKWNTQKPIQFYISSDTPEEFVSALKEGILWWNQALGEDFIQVQKLKAPVEWGDARINLLQWSSVDEVCNGASAIGPSEANPVTGQIYSGKIILCGKTLLGLYDASVDPAQFDRDEFNRRILRWTAAHEMGHVLGFTHNFKGKLYRDPKNPNITVSTVMDYPHPEDIYLLGSLGPSDVAKIRVSYLEQGSARSIEELKEYPFCSDEQGATLPDCTVFVRSGYSPSQLIERYINDLVSERELKKFDHAVSNVVTKQLFYTGDSEVILASEVMLEKRVDEQKAIIQKILASFKALETHFLELDANNQVQVLKFLGRLIVEKRFQLDTESKKELIDRLFELKNYLAFSELSDTQNSLQSAKPSPSNSKDLTEFYLVNEYLKSKIDGYWVR